MKTKSIALILLLASLSIHSFAQDEEKEEKEEKKKGFKKENLFTGGSITFGFSSNTFQIGANPVFGYNLTNWADLGLVVNYIYTSYRDFNEFDDRLRQYLYGGGLFTRLYPVRFLFVQAQFEHNFIKLKYIPAGGGLNETAKTSANSFLIGGGYTTGRQKDSKGPFYYLSILVDVSGNDNSPYTDAYGRTIPILRGGMQIPLFQGRN
jgi:hypothetical protein